MLIIGIKQLPVVIRCVPRLQLFVADGQQNRKLSQLCYNTLASNYQRSNNRVSWCFFSSNGQPTQSPSSTQTTKLDTTRRHRSILEEVLLKEEQQPKTTAQKVKQKAENAFSYIALVGAVGIFSGITYLLFDYFFAPSSPQRIYSKALKLIRQDSECQRVLGDDIAGFGEQGRRARRHIASRSYKTDEEERVRVTFHVKGQLNAGRVYVEMCKKPGESWSYRFLMLELADHSHPIVLLDNREKKRPAIDDGKLLTT